MKTSKQKSRTRKKKKVVKVPYHKKPSGMSAEKWQVTLRKQVAEVLPFRIENMNGHEVFSDFRVCNPKSGNHFPSADYVGNNSGI